MHGAVGMSFLEASFGFRVGAVLAEYRLLCAADRVILIVESYFDTSTRRELLAIIQRRTYPSHLLWGLKVRFSRASHTPGRVSCTGTFTEKPYLILPPTLVAKT